MRSNFLKFNKSSSNKIYGYQEPVSKIYFLKIKDEYLFIKICIFITYSLHIVVIIWYGIDDNMLKQFP